MVGVWNFLDVDVFFAGCVLVRSFLDELSFEFQRRFMEEFGERECHPLRKKWIPLWPSGTCENVYKRGAELAVELILTAPELIPECPKYEHCVADKR